MNYNYFGSVQNSHIDLTFTYDNSPIHVILHENYLPLTHAYLASLWFENVPATFNWISAPVHCYSKDAITICEQIK